MGITSPPAGATAGRVRRLREREDDFEGSAFCLYTLALAGLMGLFALTAAPPAEAQESMTIEYAENGEGPVVTFTAADPEGATSITWGIATDGADPDGDGPLAATDAVDGADFMIDEDGVLKFNIDAADDGSSPGSPDFEHPQGGTPGTNTYRLVVSAADAATSPQTGYHKVTVMVTNVDEEGEVTWTVDADGGDTHVAGTPTLVQFQSGASLMASATDGDISGNAKAVPSPIWRWYRAPSKTDMGTMIDGATADTYYVTPTDEGMYLRAVATYLVAGNVDQETASLTADYPVLASRLGDNKLEFDPAAISREVSEGDKGMNVGAPVMATGNHGVVNYTLADDTSGDNDKFKIDQKTGQITTIWDFDRDVTTEATATEAGNCDGGDNECVVTIRATDASGSATAVTATTDPPVFVDATVTIKLTAVDEKPTFPTTGALTSITRNENVTALAETGDVANVTYTAMDPEGRNLTYHLMGPDGDKFELSSTQVLAFKTAPDYEMPADANMDNVYMVTVRASDGTMYADRMVSVTVENVDDAPTVSGPSSVNFAENGEAPVATFTAEDPEGATSIAWDIVEGAGDPDGDGDLSAADNADAASFTIDEDGMLKFSSPPDHENPATTNATANTYKVVVVACDVELVSNACPAATAPAQNAGYHAVTVVVTNLSETGKVTWTTAADGSTVNTPTLVQFTVGTLLTATAEDGDITNATQTFTADVTDEVSGVTWRWYRGSALISGQTTNAYTVTGNDVGSRIRVTVTYRVGGNTNQETASLTSDYPVLRDRFGDNELEFDPSAVSREVSEGDEGMMVGAPVTATGNHGAINYALAGTDATRFKIDAKTGQITTMVDLDYEAAAGADDNCVAQNECVVTVTATDASGDASDPVATVTIDIKNVDEKPTFITDGSGPPAADSPTAIPSRENRTPLFSDTDSPSTTAVDVTYAATDPEGLNVNLTLMGPDAAKFTLSSGGVLSFEAEPDYEESTDADSDNVYMVTVRASDGTMYEDRMVAVTVANVDEAPEIIEGGLVVAGASSVNYVENGEDAVATYTARGPEAAMAMWELEGDDAMHFSLSTTMGAMTELMFASAPNFEMRADSDGDNVYMVTVMAMEGDNMYSHDVEVTVTNADDDGMVTVMPTMAVVGTELTATLTDPDGGVTINMWDWWISDTEGGTYTLIPDSLSDMYTPTTAQEGMYLKARALYDDALGTGKEAGSDPLMVMPADQLLANYDANGNGVIDRSDVLTAITRYLDNEEGVTRADVIALINRYLDS